MIPHLFALHLIANGRAYALDSHQGLTGRVESLVDCAKFAVANLTELLKVRLPEVVDLIWRDGDFAAFGLLDLVLTADVLFFFFELARQVLVVLGRREQLAVLEGELVLFDVVEAESE